MPDTLFIKLDGGACVAAHDSQRPAREKVHFAIVVLFEGDNRRWSL
ncbi:MAG: hypothetical protein ACKJSG_02760 [Lentisphaeria bacterium]